MRIRALWAALALLLGAQFFFFTQMPSSAASGDPTSRAVEWFARKKAPDGALPGYENGYTVGGTADGVFALAAAGENPRRFGRKSGDTPIQYLETHAADDSSANDPRDDAHLAGKVALAAVMAREDPRDFGGVDLVRLIEDRYDPLTGGYRGGFASSPLNPLGQGLAILGLTAAKEPVPQRALEYLLGSQQPDGGWEFGAGFGSDVGTSSMAVQALVAARNAFGPSGRIDDAVAASMRFLLGERNDDGGFSNQRQYAGNFCSGKRPSEVDATGFAVQAIRTGGQDPGAQPWTGQGAAGPKQFLASVQDADGSFPFQEGPDCKGNGGSTYAAVLGLQEASYVCLLDLGGCPEEPASPQSEPVVDPVAQGVAPANDPPKIVEAIPTSAQTPGVAPPRPAPRTSDKALVKPAPPAAAASSSCTLPACPAADSLPDAVASATALSADPPRVPRTKPGSRVTAGDRLSPTQGSGPDPIVFGGLAIILALSASIGRQLIKGRS